MPFLDRAMTNYTCPTRGHNSTIITNAYEGIPQTLILNFIIWCLLLLLFAFLRNRAWDYGRLALVQTEKWTQLFYKSTEEALAVEETSADTSLTSDQGCLWLPNILRINKHRLFERCGPDAANYLSFQRHLIVLMGIISLFSLAVILPVNFQGDIKSEDIYGFGHTTIGNFKSSSNLLWIHVIASICFVPISVLIMRRCSSRIPSVTFISSRTVMVTHISHTHRRVEDIRNYLQVRYPHVNIKEIQMGYKIQNLMKIDKERAHAHEAKMYCINKQRMDLPAQPKGCIICCPWNSVNALQYYMSEEERLTDLVIKEHEKALNNPLGIAFVTVGSAEEAKHMIDTFQPGSVRNWYITKAPSPSDINWENLEISTRNWYIKACSINIILFVVLFFLTTPGIIVNLFLTYTSALDKQLGTLNPIITDFLPVLLILTTSALLPVIVAYSDQWMSYWAKSRQNHATMHKTFILLLFMVLILPSLGLTSLEGLLLSTASNNITIQQECIFLADNGAFFVNYVITSALIGTAMELLRFPELAMYLWRLLLIKSEAEKVSVRKEILSVFPFGVHYTWTLLIFTICTTYSLICPLVTPFGLLYLCLKHVVDKHNIYYVYRPIIMATGEGAQIHASAIKMVRVSFVLLQLALAAFFTLKAGVTESKSLFTYTGAFTTIMVFFYLSPFPSCRRQGSHTAKYQETGEQYIAPVLVSAQNLPDAGENIVITQPDYGSSSINEFGARMPTSGSSVA